jgi:hypothetical protein
VTPLHVQVRWSVPVGIAEAEPTVTFDVMVFQFVTVVPVWFVPLV